MTKKTNAEPYTVLHRFRLSGKWVEPGGDPVQLNKRQAEGPLSQELIEPVKVVKKQAKQEEGK
jgi:hypothetical protein